MWLPKGFGTQFLLIAMIEKWKNNMDKSKSCAALLTDLNKTFDCIVHDYLISIRFLIPSPESYVPNS